MEPTQDQRRELGDFLRARRHALPAPAPNFGSTRRRTPGLRREEVAALSNVSTTWYVWAEQGRDISLSPQALARLANALQLSPAERAYLFALAARLDPDPPQEPAGERVPAELQAIPAAIAAPAYCLDACSNGCAWNEPARTLFVPWLESGEVNLLRFVFQHESAKTFIEDWPARAQRLAAEFRAETAQDPANPARHALIDSLSRESADFARFWHSYTVLAREGGARNFNHPRLGPLHYTQHNFAPSAHPGYRLVILTPAS
jgi:transcriptional regulator with XRE-family HTH domain